MQARHEHFGMHNSEQSQTSLYRHQMFLHKKPFLHMLPKYSKILGALIAVEVLSFFVHQEHGISLYSDGIRFLVFGPPSGLS